MRKFWECPRPWSFVGYVGHEGEYTIVDADNEDVVSVIFGMDVDDGEESQREILRALQSVGRGSR